MQDYANKNYVEKVEGENRVCRVTQQAVSDLGSQLVWTSPLHKSWDLQTLGTGTLSTSWRDLPSFGN